MLNSDAKVDVVVKVEPIVTKNYVIPAGNIAIENLQDGYTARIDTDAVTITVSGAKSEVDAVDANSLVGSIDVGGLGAGEHNPTATFTLEGEHCWIDNVRVPVTISGGNDEAAEDGESGGQTNTPGTGNSTTGGASGSTTGGTTGNTTDGSENTTTGTTGGTTGSGTTDQTGGGSGNAGEAGNTGTDGGTTTSTPNKTGSSD